MLVSHPVSFEVESLEDDPLEENVAKSAADQAVFDYLAFVKVSGVSSDSEWVEVHVDGYGRVRVKLST